MGLTESLYDYVMQSNNPALHPDHLHRCARLWGRCFWGEQYPDQEVLDDIENYRALELLHTGFHLRYRTWKLLVDSGSGTDTTESVFREIISTRDVCASMPPKFPIRITTDKLRNIPTFSSPPNSLVLFPPDVLSTLSTWVFVHSMPKFYYTAGYFA